MQSEKRLRRLLKRDKHIRIHRVVCDDSRCKIKAPKSFHQHNVECCDANHCRYIDARRGVRHDFLPFLLGDVYTKYVAAITERLLVCVKSINILLQPSWKRRKTTAHQQRSRRRVAWLCFHFHLPSCASSRLFISCVSTRKSSFAFYIFLYNTKKFFLRRKISLTLAHQFQYLKKTTYIQWSC